MKMIELTRRWRQLLATTVAATVTGWTAWAADLELLGYRWEQPKVTCWINPQKGISEAARADVLAALDDWNQALSDPANGVPAAPPLAMATSVRKADIVIDLKVRETRNVFGNHYPLQGWYWSLPETRGCVLGGQHLVIEGYALTSSVGNARIRNLARPLVGEALGLGHIACPQGASPCTGDVMESIHLWDLIPDVDLEISDCDLAGIAAIYTAASCTQIPASIAYTCE